MQELLKQLQHTNGPNVQTIMKEILSIATTKEITALKQFQENASEKRKGSFAYLRTCIDKHESKELLLSESPIIREQTLKALLQHEDVTDILTELEQLLKTETSYRSSKLILFILASQESKEAKKILKEYTPPPELYIEYNKLFPEKPYQEYKVQGEDQVVELIKGFEELWLSFYKYKGRKIAPGWIILEKEYDLSEHRDILQHGFICSQETAHQGSIRIQYRNEIQKEKTILNIQAAKLTNCSLHKESPWRLQCITEQVACIIRKNEQEFQQEYLPASIQAVVASSISMLYPEQTGSVLDLCCGAGTLLLEHKKRYPFSSCTGFDMHQQAIQFARMNAKQLGLEVSFYEKSMFSVRTKPVERIVCNPPFGKRVSLSKKLYGTLIKKLVELLEKDGIAIIYTSKKEEVELYSRKEKQLRLLQTIPLEISGQHIYLFCFKKLSYVR